MTKKESKSKEKTIAKILILIAILTFSLVRIFSKINNFSKEDKTKKVVDSKLMQERKLEELSGVKIIKAGSGYIAPDLSFTMATSKQLSLLKDSLSDNLLFAGIPENGNLDSAIIVVRKAPADSTSTLLENWHKYQTSMLAKGRTESVEKIYGEIKFENNYCIFYIQLADRLFGIVRLQRKGSELYILKAVCAKRKWEKYQPSFTFSVEHFTLR